MAQLYYYKARVYDATLGRFLQTDPIGYDGGMNLYAYADNDPVNNSDPSGKCEWGSITFPNGQVVNFPPAGCTIDTDSSGHSTASVGGGGLSGIGGNAGASAQPPRAGTNNSGCWYDPTSHAIGGAGVGAAGAQYGSGARTIGNNLKLYASGWGGNQYVSTMQVSKIADLGARALAAGGFFVDAYAYSQGSISLGKFGLNSTMSAVGVWGGPIGAGAAVAYFGVDYFYPDFFQNMLNKVGSASPRNACVAGH